jgi:murein DD-endopeptidase MepM/ murein hydrolase activator NlpD
MRRYPDHLLRALVLVVALAGATLPLSASAGAQQSDQDKVTQLYKQKEATDAEQEAARARLADLQKQRQALDGSLSSLGSRVAAANERLAAAQADADHFAAVAADIQAKVDDTVRQLGQARDDMRRSALLLYTQHGAGNASMLTLLDANEGSGQLVEGKHYLQRVSDKRHRDALRVTRLKNDLDIQQMQVAEQKKAADDARNAAAAEKEQLDALVAEQGRSRDAAAANEQQTNSLVANLSARQASIEADLTAASNRIAAQLAGGGDGGPAPSGFLRPVNAPITSGFGYRTDPITGATAFHSGVDFGASCGTPIKAANTGTVFQVTPESASGGYGNLTIIKHTGNVATVYGHQSSIVVSPRQVVAIGQVIGYVGSTGKSTGCHLHWEVRVNGTPVNPAGYL